MEGAVELERRLVALVARRARRQDGVDVQRGGQHHGGAPDVRHQAHTGGLRHAPIFFISVKTPQPQTSGCSRSSLWRRTWVRTALLNLLQDRKRVVTGKRTCPCRYRW